MTPRPRPTDKRPLSPTSAAATRQTGVEPDASVVVVSWNTRDLLERCLSSIAPGRQDIDLEVIVVDNGSSDESPHMVRDRFPEFRLIENLTNLGFSRANNQAMRSASGRYFILLNSEIQINTCGVYRHSACAKIP